uniref:TIL domain-containing protein n=1 Tax=Globodera rostochiensis TaxID=31243 RepID=A0A914IEA1_GLORO
MFVIVWLTTFFFIVPTILAISDEDNWGISDEDDWAISNECNCPPNEEPGQNSCNGCEPKCDDDDDSLLDCTLMFCSCSCDCKNGLVRNSRTNQCIPQEQCPEETVNKMDGRK